MHKLFFILKKIVMILFLLQTTSIVVAQESRAEYMAIVAQGRGDTIEVNSLLELYRLDQVADTESAKHFIDEGMGLAKKLNYKNGEAQALICYGDYYMNLGEWNTAKKMLNEGKTVFQSLNDKSGEASSWNSLGNIATLNGDYKLGLECYIETANLYEQNGDSLGLAIAIHNIGGMHFQQRRYDKALEHWEKGLELERKIKDSIGIVISLNAISGVYSVQKEHGKALEMQYATLEIAYQVSSEEFIAPILGNMGVSYQALNQLDSARYYYLLSLEMYKRIDEKHELVCQYNNLGMLELDLKNGEASKAYFDSSLIVSNSIESTFYLAESYGGLADANKLIGNYEEAFEWLDKWQHLKDSLTGERVQNQLNELQEKYDSEQKDNQIAKMEKRETIALLAANRQRSFLIILIISIISLALIMLFYFGRRKAREERNRAELEQKALRAQMNPHFIFNSLGAIQQMYVTGELDLANNYMSDFSSLMRKILDNSGKDSISVKEEFDMLILYLELEKGRNNEMIDYVIEIDERVDGLGTKIPPMIIQPFVENAIWHGLLPAKKKGTVRIKLRPSSDADFLICEVEDNGIGIQPLTERKGHEPKGMKLTEQRLGTKVMIENLSPGTRVTINISI